VSKSVVGVPKELKDMEGRVSMQPDGVAELVHHGHEVVVQAGAGGGAGFTDEEYAEAGARLVEGRVDLVVPNRARTASYVAESDVVVGAVLVHGAKAPKLVTRDMVASMRPGSVVADVAIDQGGCIETARPTTHSEPTYVEEGVVYYCVANIPGAVARTSTLALTSATLPYLIKIADEGIEGAASADSSLAKGLSTLRGNLLSGPVAEAHDLPHTDPEKVLDRVAIG